MQTLRPNGADARWPSLSNALLLMSLQQVLEHFCREVKGTGDYASYGEAVGR